MSNTPYTAPSVSSVTARGKAKPISEISGLKTTAVLSGDPELMRFVRAYENVMNYYYQGIFEAQVKHGKQLRDDIEQNAPYDSHVPPYDDYHMKEHMTIKNVSNPKDVAGESEGVEIESQAAYSGALEYGTAYHGIQYVFFRPAVEINQREFKLDVIKEMTKALMV